MVDLVASIRKMDPVYSSSADFLLHAAKEWNTPMQRLMAPVVAGALSLSGATYHAAATTLKTPWAIRNRNDAIQLLQHAGRMIGNVIMAPVLELAVLFVGIKPALQLLDKTYLAPGCLDRYRPPSLMKRLAHIPGFGNKARYLWENKDDVKLATYDVAASCASAARPLLMPQTPAEASRLALLIALAALGYRLSSSSPKSEPSIPPSDSSQTPPPTVTPTPTSPTPSPSQEPLLQPTPTPEPQPQSFFSQNLEALFGSNPTPTPPPTPSEPPVIVTPPPPPPQPIISPPPPPPKPIISPPPPPPKPVVPSKQPPSIEELSTNLTEYTHMQNRTLQVTEWAKEWWDQQQFPVPEAMAIGAVGASTTVGLVLAGRWKASFCTGLLTASAIAVGLGKVTVGL